MIKRTLMIRIIILVNTNISCYKCNEYNYNSHDNNNTYSIKSHTFYGFNNNE